VDTIPIEPGVAAVAAQLGQAPAAFAATGGEDYELCFCAGRESVELIQAAVGPVAITWIGEVLAAGDLQPPGVRFRDRSGATVEVAPGYEHRF
jgi:thiamine monophosphate kinase